MHLTIDSLCIHKNVCKKVHVSLGQSPDLCIGLLDRLMYLTGTKGRLLNLGQTLTYERKQTGHI